MNTIIQLKRLDPRATFYRCTKKDPYDTWTPGRIYKVYRTTRYGIEIQTNRSRGTIGSIKLKERFIKLEERHKASKEFKSEIYRRTK